MPGVSCKCGSTSMLALTHCALCYHTCSCWVIYVYNIYDYKRVYNSNDFFFFLLQSLNKCELSQTTILEVSCRLLLILLWVCTNVYWITSTYGDTFMMKLKNGQRQWLFHLQCFLFFFLLFISSGVYNTWCALNGWYCNILLQNTRFELLWMNTLLGFFFKYISLHSDILKYPTCFNVAEGLPIICCVMQSFFKLSRSDLEHIK